MHIPHLIEKKCANPKCHKTWRQLEFDPNQYCSQICRENSCSKKQTSATTRVKSKVSLEKSGDTQKSLLKMPKEQKNTEKKTQNTSKNHLGGGINVSQKTKKDIEKESNQLIDTLSISEKMNTPKKRESMGETITEETMSPTRLMTLSENLREERSDSIKQLNDVGNLLLNEAKNNPEMALRNLTEFRNIMRLKLDYVKFGVDLMRLK